LANEAADKAESMREEGSSRIRKVANEGTERATKTANTVKDATFDATRKLSRSASEKLLQAKDAVTDATTATQGYVLYPSLAIFTLLSLGVMSFLYLNNKAPVGDVKLGKTLHQRSVKKVEPVAIVAPVAPVRS